MKGKRKATASVNPGLSDAVEGQFEEGSVGEVKRRDGAVDGDNGENQEDEGEEEEEDGEEDGEAKGDGEGKEEEERPNLDEGFFEMEAIRRKRVRKVSFFVSVP
uniref:Uncharacterized protein n=1 Tax=Rhizophora mucronata TaxID=61149 RepID=A0A2P2M5Z6_RHIMU